MGIIQALVLLLSLLLATPAVAADLPTAKPGEVGLSSERLERLGQALRADVEQGRIPGARRAITTTRCIPSRPTKPR